MLKIRKEKISKPWRNITDMSIFNSILKIENIHSNIFYPFIFLPHNDWNPDIKLVRLPEIKWNLKLG